MSIFDYKHVVIFTQISRHTLPRGSIVFTKEHPIDLWGKQLLFIKASMFKQKIEKNTKNEKNPVY